MNFNIKKTCSKCNKEKEIEEFVKNKVIKSGYTNICKTCYYKRQRERYWDNVDKERKRKKEYYKRETTKHLFKKYNQSIKGTPRYIAKDKVNNAIRKGELIKRPCEICHNIKVEGHHEDYSKPLDVIWLCRKHHREVHRKW